MSKAKQDKIFTMLDDMVKTLNEQKRKLATKVKTGQMENHERHNQLNQWYVETLNSVAKDIEEL